MCDMCSDWVHEECDLFLNDSQCKLLEDTNSSYLCPRCKIEIASKPPSNLTQPNMNEQTENFPNKTVLSNHENTDSHSNTNK